jgi:hypothetical protein
LTYFLAGAVAGLTLIALAIMVWRAVPLREDAETPDDHPETRA